MDSCCFFSVSVNVQPDELNWPKQWIIKTRAMNVLSILLQSLMFGGQIYTLCEAFEFNRRRKKEEI